MCCSVLQCVAACCSVLQRHELLMYASKVLMKCVAACCSVLQRHEFLMYASKVLMKCVAACCSVLQCHELLMYASEVPMVAIPLCTRCWKFYLHEKVELLNVLPILKSRVAGISKSTNLLKFRVAGS